MQHRQEACYACRTVARVLGWGVLLGLVVPVMTWATPVTTGLRLWLDAADSATLTDTDGRHPGEAGFTGSVRQFLI